MTETKPNYEINSERDLISSTKKHLQIAWWALSIFFAVAALISFILIADAFQPLIVALKMEGLSASKPQGYLALIFFVLLFATVFFVYLLYIFKGYLQVKLGYCNDVTYIRENCMDREPVKEVKTAEKREEKVKDGKLEIVKEINDLKKNCDWVETGEPIFSVSDGKEIKSENNYNEIESIVSIAQTGQVYYLWSRKYLAYIVGVVTDEDGMKRVNYSKNASHCKAFLSEVDALIYLNEKIYSKSANSIKA